MQVVETYFFKPEIIVNFHGYKST